MKILSAILAVLLLLCLAGCKTQDVGTAQPQGIELEIDSEGGGETGTEGIQGAQEQVTEPSAQQEASPEKTATKASGKLEEDTCDETANLGFISCVPQGNDIVVKVKNAGRGEIDGFWYRFIDSSSNMIGEDSEMDVLKIGFDKELSIKMSSYPETKYVHVFPISANKICSNKQLVVIPMTSCR